MDFNIRQNEEKKPLINFKGLFDKHTELVSDRKANEKEITNNLLAIQKYIHKRTKVISEKEEINIYVILKEHQIVYNLVCSDPLRNTIFNGKKYKTASFIDSGLCNLYKQNDDIYGDLQISLIFNIRPSFLNDTILSSIETKVIKSIKTLKNLKFTTDIISIKKGTRILGNNKPGTAMSFITTKTKYF